MTPLNFQYTGDFSATFFSIKNLIIIPIHQHDQYHSSYSEERYNACLNKLQIWRLLGYEKVCWLDSDMVVMKNIDHLFDIDFGQDEILAVPGCRCNVFNNPKFDTAPHKCPYVNPNNTYINAGLILTRPDIEVFNRLIKEDYNRPLAEQDVISEFFASKINMLPPTYNYMSQLDLIHPDVDSQDVHIFHFTYDKPWQQLGRNVHQRYYKYWRHMLEEHEQSDDPVF
jgi:lipopolysaccharide biosynthesis glycosyltransferase